MKIGVISDTHDLLRPQAVAALRGVDHILHAGDICGPAVLRGLGEIARLDAVRGNNDRGAWAADLQTSVAVEFDAVTVYILHDLSELDIDPAVAGFQIVISGHSHRPLIESRDGVLYLNPGSAGPRRFTLPIAIGLLEINGSQIHAELKILEV
jgi:putative phosphoesterase